MAIATELETIAAGSRRLMTNRYGFMINKQHTQSPISQRVDDVRKNLSSGVLPWASTSASLFVVVLLLHHAVASDDG